MVAATLQTVAQQLATGSRIAFDYLAKYIIEGEGGFLYQMGRASVERTGDPWTFGIDTSPPAKANPETFLAQNGLQLAEYEVIGDVSQGEKAHGGLAVGVNGSA